jgi:methyl acetate hydrolase
MENGSLDLDAPVADYCPDFERALLRGGELDGTRILRASTADAAFTNQIGDLDFPADLPTFDPASTDNFSAGPGLKWGYGLLLNTLPFVTPEALALYGNFERALYASR